MAMSICQHSSKVNSVLFNSQIGDKWASYSPTSKPVKFTRVLSLQVSVAPGGNEGRGAGGGGEAGGAVGGGEGELEEVRESWRRGHLQIPDAALSVSHDGL